MSKKTLVTLIQYIVFLGLGVAIIFYMFGQLSEKDKAEMFDAIKSVNYWLFIPIFFVGFLSHLFRALRWKLMLEPMQIRPTTMNTTLAVLVGYIANLALPRAGEVAKCTVLARYEKVPADKMIGTIVAERAFDVLCLGVITVLAFLLQADVIGTYAKGLLEKVAEKSSSLVIAVIALVVLIVALVMVYRKFKHSKIGQFIKGLGDGVKSILQLQKRGQFIGYTVLIWSMYLLQVVIGFWSLPATAHLSVSVALVVLVFGSVGMIATQGGIGAYTLLVAQILVFYGIATAQGQAFGWASWLGQVGVVLILGIAALIILPVYNRRQHDAQAGMDTAQDIQ